MKIIFVVLTFILFSKQVYSNDKRLERDLFFTNRAQCALDSKKPASDVLVLLSNMDIDRSVS